MRYVRAQCLGCHFAARGRAGQVAPVAARFARAHREVSARPRRSASAVTSRLWQLAAARAHREASARPRRSASAVTSRLGQLASLVLIERSAHVRGGAVCCPAAPGLCDGKSALCVSIPQKEKRPAAVAAGLSLYRGAPGRYSISQQSSHTPS